MKRVLLPFSFILLASCASVGPNYKRPELYEKIKTNAMPFHYADKELYTEGSTADKWWNLFDDPDINNAVMDALKANTDLRIAVANLERSRAGVKEVQGARLPSTTVSASATRGVSAAAVSPAAEHAARNYPTLNTYDTGISAAWDLDLFGRVRRTLEASRAESGAMEELYHMTQLTVIANTVRAYTDACFIGRQIEVAQNNIRMQEESVALLERSVNAGRNTALDLAKSTALLAQLRAAAHPLEAQKKLALFRLATLTGKEPHLYPVAAAECKSFPKFNSKIPVGDGARLISRRPDIRVAERKLAAATASIGIATAGLFPSVTFGASMGLSAHDTEYFDEKPAERFSIGPLISWSFPNIIGANARIKQGKASTKAALANFDGIVLNALREVESALVSYTAELERNKNLVTARDESTKAVGFSRRLYDAGAGTYLDVLDSERNLASADAALAASDAAAASNRIALFLSLGGGWE